jgi:DNA-binding response OmpR family regulator
LAQTVGKLITRAQIASRVFGETIAPESKAIDMRMSSLRQKLADCGANLALTNIRGIGFRLDVL